MLETGTSGLMSGEGKQPVANGSRSRALPRLYAWGFEANQDRTWLAKAVQICTVLMTVIGIY